MKCYWKAEPLGRSAASLILLFLSLTPMGRAVQEPKHWCLQLFKVLYGIFPTSSCLSRSAQSLMHLLMYLPALLQVSWILWDVKNGTWCLCLGPESVPMWYSCETLTLSGEWEQFHLQFIGEVKIDRLLTSQVGWFTGDYYVQQMGRSCQIWIKSQIQTTLHLKVFDFLQAEVCDSDKKAAGPWI